MVGTILNLIFKKSKFWMVGLQIPILILKLQLLLAS